MGHRITRFPTCFISVYFRGEREFGIVREDGWGVLGEERLSRVLGIAVLKPMVGRKTHDGVKAFGQNPLSSFGTRTAFGSMSINHTGNNVLFLAEL